MQARHCAHVAILSVSLSLCVSQSYWYCINCAFRRSIFALTWPICLRWNVRSLYGAVAMKAYGTSLRTWKWWMTLDSFSCVDSSVCVRAIFNQNYKTELDCSAERPSGNWQVLDASAAVLWPWPLTFRPQNLISSSLSKEASTTKVWRKSIHRRRSCQL